jgi:hypothetical protein
LAEVVAEALRKEGVEVDSVRAVDHSIPPGIEEGALEQVGHIPSLIFYGVRSKEAALLRMAGVPRIAAEGLASHWWGVQAGHRPFLSCDIGSTSCLLRRGMTPLQIARPYPAAMPAPCGRP